MFKYKRGDIIYDINNPQIVVIVNKRWKAYPNFYDMLQKDNSGNPGKAFAKTPCYQIEIASKLVRINSWVDSIMGYTTEGGWSEAKYIDANFRPIDKLYELLYGDNNLKLIKDTKDTYVSK